MNLKLSGTDDKYNGETHANNIVINTQDHVFTCGIFDVYENKNKRIKLQFKNTPNKTYRTGVDNSGGKYEVIEYDDYSDSWYSDTIIGNNRIYHTAIQIQTWDRITIFVTLTYQHKRTNYGKTRQTSEIETAIITLNKHDSSAFAAWLESVMR